MRTPCVSSLGGANSFGADVSYLAYDSWDVPSRLGAASLLSE